MANIHPLSDVQSSNIGESTYVWQFTVILKGAVIGNYCNICSHIFIENDVKIGDSVTIKAGVQIWDGLRIGNNVFIGPNVTFTNDLYPKSKPITWECLQTVVGNNVSIGANATILPGITIGDGAFIGAGSVLTTDVPPLTVWYGNPARHKGYQTENGLRLTLELIDSSTGEHYEYKNQKITKR